MSLIETLREFLQWQACTETVRKLFSEEFGLQLRTANLALPPSAEMLSPSCLACTDEVRVVGFISQETLDENGFPLGGGVPVVYAVRFRRLEDKTPRTFMQEATASLSRYWSRETEVISSPVGGPVVVAFRYDSNRSYLGLATCTRRPYQAPGLLGMAAGATAVIHDIDLSSPSEYHLGILGRLHARYCPAAGLSFQVFVHHWLEQLSCSDTDLVKEEVLEYFRNHGRVPLPGELHEAFGALCVASIRIRYPFYLDFIRECLPELLDAVEEQLRAELVRRRSRFGDTFGLEPSSETLAATFCAGDLQLLTDQDVDRILGMPGAGQRSMGDVLASLARIRTACGAEGI